LFVLVLFVFFLLVLVAVVGAGERREPFVGAVRPRALEEVWFRFGRGVVHQCGTEHQRVLGKKCAQGRGDFVPRPPPALPQPPVFYGYPRRAVSLPAAQVKYVAVGRCQPNFPAICPVPLSARIAPFPGLGKPSSVRECAICSKLVLACQAALNSLPDSACCAETGAL